MLVLAIITYLYISCWPDKHSYVRNAKVIYLHTQTHSFSYFHSCLLVLKFPASWLSFKIVILISFKDALLENPNPNEVSGTTVPIIVTPC